MVAFYVATAMLAMTPARTLPNWPGPRPTSASPDGAPVRAPALSAPLPDVVDELPGRVAGLAVGQGLRAALLPAPVAGVAGGEPADDDAALDAGVGDGDPARAP